MRPWSGKDGFKTVIKTFLTDAQHYEGLLQ